MKLVFVGAGLGHDVFYRYPPHDESVGNQRTMALPRNGLGTHDCGPFVGCPGDEFGEGRLKLRSQHLIGKGAKRCVSPAAVGTVLGSAAQSTQSRQVEIIDVDTPE